jgi:acyl-CoA thioesterase-1
MSFLLVIGLTAVASGTVSSKAKGSQTVLVLGDSLSAAYGIARESGWVALLAQRLRPHQVINASVSGETTAGGLSRLPALLATHKPHIVVLALGANDGLRGLPVPQTKRNLDAMINLISKQHGQVLLVGMQLPPNYGTAYTSKFQALFTQLAKEKKVPLLPFLLAGIATNAAFFQADGLHPTAQAQPILLNTVWRELQLMLDNKH